MNFWANVILSDAKTEFRQNGNSKNTCTAMFITALFTIAKTWRQPKCPLTEKWIKNMQYIYTVEYYSAIKQ